MLRDGGPEGGGLEACWDGLWFLGSEYGGWEEVQVLPWREGEFGLIPATILDILSFNVSSQLTHPCPLTSILRMKYYVHLTLSSGIRLSPWAFNQDKYTPALYA